jgi:polysaccharide export outer membrane protein
MTIQKTLRTTLFLIAAVVAFAAHGQDKQAQPEYQIGAGDNIRITVFQNPDLSVETRVTENGTVSYPLIGSVRIGGLPIPAAEAVIAKALKDGNFIQQPQVNISLLANRGNQVSVLGVVGRPGRFPLETFNTRLSEMIAIAGGITAGGADTVILTGTRAGKPLRKVIDIPAMFLDDKLDDDIVVAGGDVIYVHRQAMFYIYGEVQRPGSFRIERGMTVRQALAQAGGPSQRGTERNLRVYRRGAGGQIESINPEMHATLQPDDVLYVQESLF